MEQRGAEEQLHSLNLGARLRCLVNITLRPFYPWARSPVSIKVDRKRGGCISSMDVVRDENISYNWDPNSSLSNSLPSAYINYH